MRKISAALIIVVAILTFCISVFAQGPGGPKYASTSARTSPSSVKPGSTATLIVSLDVSPGYHVNSVKPNDPDLIATNVVVGPLKDLKVGSPVYPKSDTITAPSLSQKPLSVYKGLNKITAQIKVASSTKPGKYTIPVSISYQGCKLEFVLSSKN